jgi:elongation factor P
VLAAPPAAARPGSGASVGGIVFRERWTVYETSDLRKGLKVEIDGEPHVVTEANFVKPGKGNAFTRCKLKSLVTGLVLERTWRSGEKIDSARLEERPMQFLYEADEQLHFMDTGTYEQVMLTRENVGDAAQWLTENLDVDMLFHNNKPLSIDLPNFVELDIVDTEPGIKGDTKSNAMKPATLNTGAIVQVPLFVEQGETIKIDTRTGSYVERVKR